MLTMVHLMRSIQMMPQQAKAVVSPIAPAGVKVIRRNLGCKIYCLLTYFSACLLQKYGCNILNLGNSRIISVHPETARQIVRFPGFSGDVQTIAFDAITSMYGACHCSSAVVRRIPRRYENTDVAR